jgi:hypothetical protein
MQDPAIQRFFFGNEPEPPTWWSDSSRGDYGKVSWQERRRCMGRGCRRRGVGIVIARNGAKSLALHCLQCGRRIRGIRKEEVKMDISTLPVIKDNRQSANGCLHPSSAPALVIAADGRETGRLACTLCDTLLEHCAPPLRTNGRVIDLRVDGEGFTLSPPCEHCGSSGGSQLHHWAPRALFPDADRWPTGWLCSACHSHWHVTTRTHTRQKETA